MRRRSILCRCFPPLMESSCDLSTYAVLTAVSAGYPPAKGRLPTYYSPVRHWSIAAPVRLACIRHAASVHPEPGSNSPLSLSSSRLSVCFGSFFFSSSFSSILFGYCRCVFSSLDSVQFSVSSAGFSADPFILHSFLFYVNSFFDFFLRLPL